MGIPRRPLAKTHGTTESCETRRVPRMALGSRGPLGSQGALGSQDALGSQGTRAGTTRQDDARAIDADPGFPEKYGDRLMAILATVFPFEVG